ncbi:hypothetical protein FJR48_06525 [Sulfurimonas lithotrophica]|uniref:NrS-1 polymerase-like helicase domain-containing protein n=1 Tax=Sulfurimonas lithotrophica TaxID=2590022 RepID=A0A5P8P103_9BACT|nr:primase-helicase family protein [Sulfurimonas lithotrophica]QFR49398.1 hypothetical protein FJR48_06525 [Sulfurimonas lithotrophica]
MNNIKDDAHSDSEIIDYKGYLNKICQNGSQYQLDIGNFELNYKSMGYKYRLSGFFAYLDIENKITPEYMNHFVTFMNEQNRYSSIHPATYASYNLILNFYLVKNRYNYETVKNKGVNAYKENNFKKYEDREILNQVYDKGGAVWLNSKGNICIRFSIDSEHKEYNIKQAGIVLSNFLDMDIEFSKENRINKSVNSDKVNICTKDLLLIQEEVFNVEQHQEFIEVNGLWYKNRFKPSKLLQLNKQPQNVPVHIFYLISHLVNYDVERCFAFINWLAAFFQTLKKSQIAILFKGDQGAGKGTLFKLIEELFGKVYCKQINGDSLRSNYLGAFIENTLFLNFDEISYKTIGKTSFNSLLKAIITNDEVTAEKKNINMDNATKIYAQTILFSNVDHPINIEESDRRFTVFTTGGNIKETDFFGHGSFDKFEQAMMNEIEDFAMYLKLYNIDVNQANMPFETQEKYLMVNRTENNLKDFVNAILNKNMFYFQRLKNIDIGLLNTFINHLIQERVYQKYLIIVYTALYPQDKYIESARTLIKQVEKIAPDVFGDHNLYKSNGDKYYKLYYEVDVNNSRPMFSDTPFLPNKNSRPLF